MSSIKKPNLRKAQRSTYLRLMLFKALRGKAICSYGMYGHFFDIGGIATLVAQKHR